MTIHKTAIDGVVIIEPRVFNDARGYFFESFSDRDFNAQYCAAIGNPSDYQPIVFVQDNESCSQRGVMRGLHFQYPPYTQSKLVRCVQGKVLDVAVDLRKDSPTYGKHVSCVLSADNHLQFFVPKGFAHGFSVLSPTATFLYKCDDFYHPESEGGINILDNSLDIDWQIPAGEAILSEKDTRHQPLSEFISPF